MNKKLIIGLALVIALTLAGTGWAAGPYYLNTATGGGYVPQWWATH